MPTTPLTQLAACAALAASAAVAADPLRYTPLDLQDCAARLSAPAAGKPPTHAVRARLAFSEDLQVTDVVLESDSGSADYDAHVLAQLKTCKATRLGTPYPTRKLHAEYSGHVLVAVPEDSLAMAYRLADPSRCVPSAADYPRAAARAGATGDIEVAFAVTRSGRMAIAQLLNPGRHPTLESSSFAVLVRCAYAPPTQGAFRIHRADVRWRLE